jgi:hypothetical protein
MLEVLMVKSFPIPLCDPMFLKVVLFWFQGRGRPYKGGTPYGTTDSKSLILGLSNEVSFVSELSLKGGQTTQNTFPKICCTKIPVHQCNQVVK